MEDEKLKTRPTDPPRVEMGIAHTMRPTQSMPAVAPREDIQAGALIHGTYRLLKPLGEGGMGIVMHGIDERLERDVAIKFIHPERVLSDSMREQFLQEARAMARLRHPNLVEIFAFGEFAGSPYFVMEYVHGTDLRTWISEQRDRRLSLDEALGVVDQLSRGVSALHEAGAVHRDLKPSNVLIGPGFRVAVTDLGLARRLGDLHPDDTIAGTPAYIAPEVATMQSLPQRYAHSADVYALGVITFELLTGQLPFDADNPADLLEKHVHEPPPRPSELRPELPGSLDRVILRALAKDPMQRTESADAFRRELSRARDRLSRGTMPLRVLIADDEDACRKWTGEFVREAFPGATVDDAVDGRDALRRALEHPPDVAIIDLSMPHLNGVELTAALRASPKTRNVPIVVITGVGGADDWKLLHRLGAAGFLVKPLDPDALTAMVRRLTRRDAGSALL
jgi:serine/threonine-protein kinase